jgi:aspartyl protease family protein
MEIWTSLAAERTAIAIAPLGRYRAAEASGSNPSKGKTVEPNSGTGPCTDWFATTSPNPMPPLTPNLLVYSGIALAALIIISMITRRIPVIGSVLRLACWALLLVLLFGAVQQRQMFDPTFAHLTRLLRLDGGEQQVSGTEMHIPMASDGHFWVRVTIDGVRRRMLVDSGATFTAVSESTATAAGLKPTPALFPVVLKTANGAITARTASVSELRLGNIVARDLGVVVSPTFEQTEVVGMNFLSRLQSWRVEGRTLILVPHHPQPLGALPRAID